ncbi:hypothetical protein [Streptomyces fructofermentans]|uniref:hypothetical protein n=1 Tax=Streptomyces fructofermentans TaxID=152141 RepID=UPI003791D437
MQVKTVSHSVAGTGPAALAPALGIAHELHAPRSRAPEVAPAAARSTRRGAARARRPVRG